MLANKLFPLLGRPEVQEIVLLGGKAPCALVNGTYRRLSSQTLRDEDILSVVMAARGQEHALRLADGVQWEYLHPVVGRISVSAGYDGSLLRMSMRLAQSRSVRDMPAVRPPTDQDPRQGAAGAIDADAANAPSGRPRSSASSQNLRAQQAAAAARGAGAAPVTARGAGVARSAGAGRGARFNPTELDSRPLSSPAMPAVAPRPQPLELDARAQRFSPMDLDEPALAPQAQPARPVYHGDALDGLLGRAREMQASDLHMLADRPAMLRIAGDLVPQPETPRPEELEALLLPRLPERMRDMLEKQGSCDFSLIHEAHGRFRANVSRQRTGLKLTARPIGDVATLAQLGLPESIGGALEHHQGLIVITGPTGHGKTTTMAALVGILNRETKHHVITVEDPIEYVHATANAVISQREVGTHTKTFGAALKGALREDPDVIVVGELRDTETVRMALSASETGHLVISTMNTPSAAKAIERLIDLFPPSDQPQVRMTLAGGLRLIISQRLVPSADRKQLYAAAEVLPGSTPLWNLIRDNRTFQIASLQQRGKSLGIIRLDDSLAELVKKGHTTMEIAREYADSPDLVETLVVGRPQQVRADAAPENQNDPANNLQKRGVELGKQVMSRAGKLFGGDNNK
jgi:twitching motility protein PilT